MSTPAAAALNDANAAGAGSGTSAAASGAAANGAGTSAAGNTAGNAAAVPTQFWSGWDKPDQKDTRDWVANKNYADPFTLAKTAQGLEKEAATLRAGKGYPVDKPGPDGKPVRDENAWKAWNALTGVPETADKYDIPLPPNNPYPEFKGYMAEAMLDAGVPAGMASKLAKGYEAAVGKMEAQIREQENVKSAQELKELENQWGSNYTERVALAARGKEWLSREVGGLSDMQLRTMEAVLGTAKFMSAMWKFGAGNKEGSFAGGNDGGSQFTGTASDAQARLNQIQADRAAGKINDHQWRGMQSDIDGLRDQIVRGMAPMQ